MANHKWSDIKHKNMSPEYKAKIKAQVMEYLRKLDETSTSESESNDSDITPPNKDK